MTPCFSSSPSRNYSPTSASLTSRSFHRPCCFSTQDLRRQTVAIVGLGISGRAAARLALARGASVVAVDRNERWTPPDGDPIVDVIGEMRTILGPCWKGVLEDADRIVVSPGVSIEKYGLSELLRSGRQVMSELDFAAEVLPPNLKVITVTGTNGKSTVTSFAAQILCHFGIKASIGGNFGIPLSETSLKFLRPFPTEQRCEVAVIEVSSAQMEIPTRYFQSSVALVLNLTPDHLERHKTMKNYAVTKCRVLTHMKHNKLALLPAGNTYLKDAFSSCARGCNAYYIGDFPGVKVDMGKKVAFVTDPYGGSVGELNLRSLRSVGSHNCYNAAAAAFAVLGLDCGIDLGSISTIIDKLNSLPHRIQFVCKDAGGLAWIDDSKSTNVGASYEALMALKKHKLVVLFGGISKLPPTNETSGFGEFVEILNSHRGVITFGYSGDVIQRDLLNGGLVKPCVRSPNLEDAVKEARKMARHGDTVLLSPGCSSFDEFENFEHRGNRFQQLARSTC